MSDSSRPPAKSVVVSLFAVAATAVVAASVLTVVAVAKAGPSRGSAAESGERPSPTPRESGQPRAAGLPLCLVGSWLTVEEQSMVKFYNDADPILFSSSGRHYEFRPDGTGTERQDNVTLTGTHQGNELKIVANGTNEFKWKATDKQLTYLSRTNTTITYSFYDQRGLIATQPQEAKQDLNEVDDYACEGNQAAETNPAGYRARWARTDGSGVYG
ncbi:hypothetical protein ABZ816_02440 [Actinosynnema sp. NPDC047251]|uniref:hypothetical protein n=1 Tax=Saccharothrix espanaensis TaxID=103731 RepID=UPI0011DD8960|nr:hypothetical protein [Saccharothrix espanaensis]